MPDEIAPLLFDAESFEKRFPEIILSLSEKQQAKVLWDEMGKILHKSPTEQNEQQRKLRQAPQRVMQAVMRVVALCILNPCHSREENPFD